MSDEYSNVAKGKLKLKNDSQMKSKKKKKASKEKVEMCLDVSSNSAEGERNRSTAGSSQAQDSNRSTVRQLTKAELKFKQMQEKMQKKRILDKASQTHKQRVEKFNEHLDSLTEHFDIPKVSWTK